MQAQPTIEPTARRRTILARLWSVIRGDKYMADAYPPAAPQPVEPVASQPEER
jgi:hypothetical protein